MNKRGVGKIQLDPTAVSPGLDRLLREFPDIKDKMRDAYTELEKCDRTDKEDMFAKIDQAQKLVDRIEGTVKLSREEINRIEELLNSLVKKICPRRYQTPANYISPTKVAEQLAVCAAEATGLIKPYGESISKTREEFGLSLTYVANQLAKYKSPTYFISRPLLEMVDYTVLPDNLKLSNIVWPLPSFQVMLPVGYLTHKGSQFNFICITVLQPGPTKIDLIDPPMNGNISGEDGPFVRVLSFAIGKSASNAILCNSLLSADFGQFKSSASANPNVAEYGTAFGWDEDDVSGFTNRLMELALKIVLAMSARPEYVEKGVGLARPEKVRHGQVWQEALWNPNFIGRNYRRQVERQEHQGGTVRPHIRRGHWRNQVYGNPNLPADLRPHKMILIDSIWVNFDEE
jgi:hypothetical protein